MLISSGTSTFTTDRQSKKRTAPQDNTANDSDSSSVSYGTISMSNGSISNERKSKRQRTKEEKKYDRIMANRRSARESRERKKMMMDKLELTVQHLTNENIELRERNEKLQRQVEALILLSSSKTKEYGTGSPSAIEQVPSLQAHPNVCQFSNGASVQGLHLAMLLNQSPIMSSLANQASLGMIGNTHIAALMSQKTKPCLSSSLSGRMN
uniref:BZIP domain-containing protein n=1 Tax=Ditylum brightwellii TaxID=49249 RepID=A0A7S1YP35_9STRA